MHKVVNLVHKMAIPEALCAGNLSTQGFPGRPKHAFRSQVLLHVWVGRAKRVHGRLQKGGEVGLQNGSALRPVGRNERFSTALE